MRSRCDPGAIRVRCARFVHQERVDREYKTLNQVSATLADGTTLHLYSKLLALLLRVSSLRGADAAEIEDVLKKQVRKAISPIATPDRIQVVPGLPKTRSGKIMRRILRKIAEGNYDQLGDISTLAEPQVVEQIVGGHQKS